MFLWCFFIIIVPRKTSQYCGENAWQISEESRNARFYHEKKRWTFSLIVHLFYTTCSKQSTISTCGKSQIQNPRPAYMENKAESKHGILDTSKSRVREEESRFVFGFCVLCFLHTSLGPGVKSSPMPEQATSSWNPPPLQLSYIMEQLF